SICYNRVTNCLNRLHDSGGIYTIGQMPGTIINENYVEGIPAAAAYQPTYGLHNDEGTAYIEENDNVLEIDPNVTYTINCEDYGQKHHLKIKRTYATVNKMGKNPPDSEIDTPIVVKDNVWPFAQYKVCLNSGLDDDHAGLVPGYLLSDADRVFPAACETTGGSVLPVRSSGSKDNTIWLAPSGTTSFTAGDNMTKASGTATKIKTPAKEGEYYLYVVGNDGTVKSRSKKLLRIKGTSIGIPAISYDVNSGTELENCSEGGQDVAYINNGDYIGYKGVDFGKSTEKIDFRVASNLEGGKITIKLGSPDGKTIGEVDVTNTGGWQKWKTETAKIEKTSGVKDVYFVFSGNGTDSLFNLSWWNPDVQGSSDDIEVVYGDTNEDGKINIADVIMLKNAALGGEYSANGDFDENEKNDSDDVSKIIEFFIGKITSFIA
ncbi:MAG: carbohydrate-binding protein, partial [Oscillospiraceae bacterium]|nr:carbohydrate-binding protein [Oscillospiraceae bacterium]